MVLLLGAGTLAGAEGEASEIYACVNNSSGEVKIVDADTTCKGNWTLLEWNTQGPIGPIGPAGPTGPQGEMGPAGPQGPAGPGSGFGATTVTAPAGGTGGSPFSILCPAGSALTRVDGRAGSNVDKVEAFCQPVTVGLVIGLGPAASAGAAGGGGGSPFSLPCPAGSAVTGVSGTTGGLIDQLRLTCTELGAAGSSTTPTVGSSFGQPAYALACPPGAVATGLEGRGGTKIDQLKLVCQ